MNKTELINAVAAKTKSTKKDAGIAVEAVFDSIQEELAKGGKVQILGFGAFEVRARKERQGRNPQSGGALTIPAFNIPVFFRRKSIERLCQR